MTEIVRSNFQNHPFHLVSPSPWPFNTSFSLFTLTISGALAMHTFSNAYNVFYSAFLLVIFSMAFWFRDIISEGTFLGNHTLAVQKGLNLGILLFIVSEALFFLAIFWAFFHSALTPTIELGAQWPPAGIEPVNPFELPLLNTVNLNTIDILYINIVVWVEISLYTFIIHINFNSYFKLFFLYSYGHPPLRRITPHLRWRRERRYFYKFIKP